MDSITSWKQKPVIHLVYPCYICPNNETSYSKASPMIKHVHDFHGASIPSRTIGIRRPYNPKFKHQTNPKLTYDETQLGCPSYWYHTESFNELKDHIETEHDPITVVKDTLYVYDGSNPRYEKNAVNGIFEQINAVRDTFESLLKM